ncbi:hypothetical protein [Frateuria sp. YIM B11624]|uniref:hypothetical protein n=1 Tax=Frateuria sp. YIM B11624 TaxID=3143185 RepID=UPI003C76787E
MHPEEVEERRRRWNELWRTRFVSEVSKIRPVYHGEIHQLLKAAYYLGTNDERKKHEPTRLGGCD